MLACFDKLHEIDGPFINPQVVRRDFVLAEGAVAATPDVDDASLMGFRANTATLIGALATTVDNAFVGPQAPAAAFLTATASLEEVPPRGSAHLRMLAEKWKNRL